MYISPNPLSPKSDLGLISPYSITAESNMKLMRMNYGQLADGPTRRRIKSSRDVGELVVNPI